MIMTVEQLKNYINPKGKTDEELKDRLQALELLIRKYTNNNFQARAYRCTANIIDGTFYCSKPIPFKANDTIQISDGQYNDGLFTVKAVNLTFLDVNEDVYDEHVMITKVEYPMDVKIGVANLVQWDIDNRKKAGIQSETISRHSVTYSDMGSDNYLMGYPASLMGFLKPYKKARF